MALGLFPTMLGGVAGTPAALAGQSSVGLGTATSFAVLAGTTVTNTGPTKIFGDLGVSPGTAVTGGPEVSDGTEHRDDDVARQAQSDLTTGYNQAAGRTPATAVSPSDLGGRTLAPGVYKAASALGLTGTVTLDGQNDPAAVFIFQAGSTLITAPNSTVKLIRGVQPCNVFWQVGSSATLGTDTAFVGSILALTSVTVETGTTVAGRVLARNAKVSLDDSTITRPTCMAATTTAPTDPDEGGDGSGDTGGTGGSGTDGTGGDSGTDGTGGSGSTGTGGSSGSGGSGSAGTGGGVSGSAGTNGTGGRGGTSVTGGTDSSSSAGVTGRFSGTGLGTEVGGESSTNPEAPTPAVPLARTGSPITAPLLLAAIALLLGAVARRFGRAQTLKR
jgi:hypothetical protein